MTAAMNEAAQTGDIDVPTLKKLVAYCRERCAPRYVRVIVDGRGSGSGGGEGSGGGGGVMGMVKMMCSEVRV